MSNETSRVEAAAKAAHEAGDWDVTWTGDDWRAEVGRLEAAAALAAADADDLANGIRRVSLACLSKAIYDVNPLHFTGDPEPVPWERLGPAWRAAVKEKARAVLAAAASVADG